MKPAQIDEARRLVRARRMTPPEISRLLRTSDRTVQRYVYEVDVCGTSEPPLEQPGNGGPHWWMRGSKHHNSKLEEPQVVAVWVLKDRGLSAEQVIDLLELPVKPNTIESIWREQSWTWLTSTLKLNGRPP